MIIVTILVLPPLRQTRDTRPPADIILRLSERERLKQICLLPFARLVVRSREQKQSKTGRRAEARCDCAGTRFQLELLLLLAIECARPHLAAAAADPIALT